MSDSVSIQSGKADISTSQFILATLRVVLKRAPVFSERPSLKQSCTSTRMPAAFNPCALSGSSKPLQPLRYRKAPMSVVSDTDQNPNAHTYRHLHIRRRAFSRFRTAGAPANKARISRVTFSANLLAAMTLSSLPQRNPRKLIRPFRRLFLQFGSPPWKGFPGIPTAVLKVSYFSAHGSPVRQQNGSADHAPAQRWQPSLP